MVYVSLKHIFLETWFRRLALCFVLATLHKDGLGLLIRSFWFGVTYLRSKGGKLQWSLLHRLGLCYVLVPLEVGPIVADLTLRGYDLPTRFFVTAS